MAIPARSVDRGAVVAIVGTGLLVAEVTPGYGIRWAA